MGFDPCWAEEGSVGGVKEGDDYLRFWSEGDPERYTVISIDSDGFLKIRIRAGASTEERTWQASPSCVSQLKAWLDIR